MFKRLLYLSFIVGSYSEWKEACREALNSGWTHKQIRSVLCLGKFLSLLPFLFCTYVVILIYKFLNL